MSEQQRAREAYRSGQQQRDPQAVQQARDNARINGAATSGSNAGGAR